MLFSSTIFLFLFLPCVVTLYFLTPRRLRNFLLLGASLLFYAYGEPIYLWVFLLSIGLNHVAGLLIEKYRNTPACFRVFVAALCLDLGLLSFYKYGAFFIENYNRMVAAIGMPVIVSPTIHLPVGISFFTFHAISYVFDVYRGRSEAQQSIFQTALYISLFPQLIAGPIIRYHDIAKQLEQRISSLGDCSAGIKRFVVGLGKKVLIADAAGLLADKVFSATDVSASVAWLGVFAYTLQIYYDFSGYSDMAIGLGRIFGFYFPENFNYPYIAKSITEFWRRWHISLTSWFRDYLWFPLGANRRSGWRTAFNVMTVFFLCGLWHGARWTFVVWGLYHGLFLVIEQAGLGRLLEKSPRVLQHLYALLVVAVGWVLFRAESFQKAVHYLSALVGLTAGEASDPGLYLDAKATTLLVIGAIGAMPLMRSTLSRFHDFLESSSHSSRALGSFVYHSCSMAGHAIVFTLCAMTLASGTYNAFIYFRF